MFVEYGCRSSFDSSETEGVGQKTDKPGEENIETHVCRSGICRTYRDSNASACE